MTAPNGVELELVSEPRPQIRNLRLLLIGITCLVVMALISAKVNHVAIENTAIRLDRLEAMHGTEAAHPDHPARFRTIKHTDREEAPR